MLVTLDRLPSSLSITLTILTFPNSGSNVALAEQFLYIICPIKAKHRWDALFILNHYDVPNSMARCILDSYIMNVAIP